MRGPEVETLHLPFIEFLRDRGIPFVRARDDVESTIAAGHPDFTLIASNRTLMIEFKTKGKTTSTEQVARIEELEKAGNHVHVLRDLGIAIELTNAWHSSLGEILPATKGKAAPSEPELLRFGASVFRRTQGRLVHVRVATAADASLPSA